MYKCLRIPPPKKKKKIIILTENKLMHEPYQRSTSVKEFNSYDDRNFYFKVSFKSYNRRIKSRVLTGIYAICSTIKLCFNFTSLSKGGGWDKESTLERSLSGWICSQSYQQVGMFDISIRHIYGYVLIVTNWHWTFIKILNQWNCQFRHYHWHFHFRQDSKDPAFTDAQNLLILHMAKVLLCNFKHWVQKTTSIPVNLTWTCTMYI